jgi:glycosyltransferase involved in cell wall biosynthesis
MEVGVALIIPAYNEADNIMGVLDIVQASPLLDKIIVVDDGSEDNTAEVASRYDRVQVIRQANRGKAGAMQAGIEATNEAYLLFLDADLLGLTPEHIADLIDPVVTGQCEMTMGLFYGPPHPSRWAHRVSPGLSGQRAVRREVFDMLENYGELGYGIETAFTKLVNKGMVKMVKVRLDGVSQRMKEEKSGFVSGAKLRAKMFYEVVRTWLSRPYKRV